MELEKDYHVVVNHKKIIRIKKEYGLKTQIRVTNQHRASFEKVRKWCMAENILNRNFNQKLPEQAYATDVTYLILNNGLTYYLSAIKDLGPKEISAYEVSENHDVELILNTLNKLKRNEPKAAIMHSDRGGIYTSFQYIQKLKEMNLIRSMSRSGECLDNASIETFFGHLKDEVNYKECKNIAELRDKIDKYVYYYNTGRYQWNLKRMAPKEYRHFLEKSYGPTPL